MDTTDRYPALTRADRVNLNCFGKAYTLQHQGFTRLEAARLAFVRLLVQNGVIGGANDGPAAEE